MMKRYSVVAMGAVLLMSSCMSGAGAGAYMGSSLGSVLGSAIGGIAGGPRGSDIGTIVGMAGGAIAGAAIGDAADKQQAQAQHDVLARRNQRIQREKTQHSTSRNGYNDSYDSSQDYIANNTNDIDPSQMVDNSNSGDDRIDFSLDSDKALPSAESSSNNATMAMPSIGATHLERASNELLEIRNVHFVDDSGDGVLKAGETGKLVLEIYNRSQHPVMNIVPTVAEAAANRYVYISPSILVESIGPGQGIRYTASIKADRKIKDGEIKLMVSAMRGDQNASYTTVVKVPVEKR